MGLMDRVRVQAGQLAHQGQAKLGEMQTKKQADVLLRNLGAAVYAAQRTGGAHDAVETAMAALDAHAGEHGPIDTAPTPPPAWATAPVPGTTPGAGGTAGASGTWGAATGGDAGSPGTPGAGGTTG